MKSHKVPRNESLSGLWKQIPIKIKSKLDLKESSILMNVIEGTCRANYFH